MTIKNQKTILLVEDEGLIALDEKLKLEEYGYNVLTAKNAKQAIEVFNTNAEINLVLMDIDLGKGMDGTEAAKNILNIKDLPILFLSSHIEREIVQKTENISSYGYVVKNSGMTVLDTSIKMAFQLHEARQKLSNQQIKIESQNFKLELTEKRYRRLFESAKDGILILDPNNGLIVDVNPFLIEMLGYSKEEFCNRCIWEISSFKNSEYSKTLFKELLEKDYVRYEDIPLETISGNQIHVEFVSNVYLVDRKKVIQCNIRNITERRQHEAILTQNIIEKTALLKELQHRTKNSFNMITSLISLRSCVTQSKETKKVLEELTYRVKSISDLYSLLYETNSIYEVDLKIYCKKVIEPMLNFSKNIEIIKSIESIIVSSKYASTLGMILVELLSNALKYAFTEKENGKIHIRLGKVKSEVVLIIQDNGKGFSESFDMGKISGMGLPLVQTMVLQLKGKIKFSSEKGTKITIECPL